MCVKGQSGLVHFASYLQFGCTNKHFSANLQLGKALQNKNSLLFIFNILNDYFFLFFCRGTSQSPCMAGKIASLLTSTSCSSRESEFSSQHQHLLPAPQSSGYPMLSSGFWRHQHMRYPVCLSHIHTQK